MIRLENINMTFKENLKKPLKVLEDINLEIKSGEFFVFLGPSGSGKSTILRIMSGLEKSYQGKIILSEEISSKDFGFVFQQFGLFPWLTVWQNIELALNTKKMSFPQKKLAINEKLIMLGLEKFAQHQPRELSGGMRQRVGLARALVANPQVIFMDEPFSELDSFTAEELRLDLLKIWQEQKVTIIMVTHLIEEALQLADRIAVLTSCPGKVKKIIHNSLSRPRIKRSNEFYQLEDELFSLIKPDSR